MGTNSKNDLRDNNVANKWFSDFKPTVVFHLAAKVGGIHANSNYKADFYSDNVLINTNVVNASVKNNIEYIIVITPSKDKTLDKVLKYKGKIDKIIICKKRGIFTNMNVGSYYATGKYINFMNSGDFFFRKRTIEHIFKKTQTHDVIYGDCMMYYESFLRIIKSKQTKKAHEP